MQKIIIDANVWIRFARVKDIAPLLMRLTKYSLVPFTNSYLLSEIFDALVKNEWMNEKQAYTLILYIKRITYHITEKAVYRISPDPKDNYLFDMAVQNNCSFIISDDFELIKFALKPVPVHTSS